MRPTSTSKSQSIPISSCGLDRADDRLSADGSSDAEAAKRFFRRALNEGNSIPRVINVDKNPAYQRAVEDLKADGTIGQRCLLRQCKYLNNVVEQSHRNVKRRTWLAKGYGSLPTAWRTLRGIEAMEMVSKGRARWVAKGDAVRQAKFINKLFGVAA